MSQTTAFIKKLSQHVNVTSEIEKLITDFVLDVKKKEKKEKKVKEDKPKKALNAYILFCKDQRATVKSEHPEMDSKQITSELGCRWGKEKQADSELFQKYKKMQCVESEEKKEKKEVEKEVEEVEEKKEKKEKKQVKKVTKKSKKEDNE